MERSELDDDETAPPVVVIERMDERTAQPQDTSA